VINLFINYFDHQDKRRKREIEYCLKKNKENPLIDNITILNKNGYCTYGDFLREMAKYPKDINIISNLDVYFDETIKLAEEIGEGECYALTRWEFVNGKVVDFNARHGRPSPPEWSQDAWIFRGSVLAGKFDKVKALNKHQRITELIPFTLGIPGCDNKFAALLKEQGLKVTNPSKDIKAIHVHKESRRSYPSFQILSGIKPHGSVKQVSL
jgi:hypothetical protein